MKIIYLMAAVAIMNLGAVAQNSSLSKAEKEALDRQNYQNETVNNVMVQNGPMVTIGSTGNKGPFDNYVEIGSGTDVTTWPVYYVLWSNYWENNRSQTLFLASELGASTTITGLQWNFERISTSNNALKNVVIKILGTSSTSLAGGGYVDMSSATTVYTNASLIPATAVGWGQLIDIADFTYNGTDNLIVEVIWGDNGYFNSTHFRNYATNTGTNRMIYGYDDSQTPPIYDGVSTYIHNIRFYYENAGPPPAVPLSNWAFALIGLAAVSFLVFKFRK